MNTRQIAQERQGIWADTSNRLIDIFKGLEVGLENYIEAFRGEKMIGNWVHGSEQNMLLQVLYVSLECELSTLT